MVPDNAGGLGGDINIGHLGLTMTVLLLLHCLLHFLLNLLKLKIPLPENTDVDVILTLRFPFSFLYRGYL